MARMKGVGLGQAEAMIVGAASKGGLQGLDDTGGEAAGMNGVADGAVNLLDKFTGGAVTDASGQLNDLQFWLKVSIACSVVAGLAGFASLVRRA